MTNARYLLMTGSKTIEKVYYRHSGQPGHLKVTTLPRMAEKKVFLAYSELKKGHWGDFATCSVGNVTKE